MSPLPEQAVVLVGGEGTRLQPLTYGTPKALLPVVNRPLVSFELEWLARWGVRQAILAGAEHADRLRQGLGERVGSMELVYVEERRRLGTAGALRNVADRLAGTCWALNGDLIFDFDPRPLVERHRQAAALVTVPLRRVEDVSPFGLVECDRQGRVTSFREKAPSDPTGRNTVNCGLYLLEPEALAGVPPGQPYSCERELFPALLAAGATVLGYLAPDMTYWADVGRLETYLGANRDLLAGALSGVGPSRAASAQVAPGAQIVEPCCLGEAVQVEAGAAVGPSVTLGAGTVVGPGARLEDCLVLPGARIGGGAHLVSVVVGAGESVPERHLQQGGVICSG